MHEIYSTVAARSTAPTAHAGERLNGSRHDTGLRATDRAWASKERTFRALIADNHPIVRDSVSELISRQPNLVVIGQASTANEALQMVMTMEPDLLVADFNLPGSNGLELIKDIHSQRPGVAILILSMHDEAIFAERVLRAGGRGYIMKDESCERIASAINMVVQGEVYLSERMKSRVLQNVASGGGRLGDAIDRLSDRELEVFRLIGNGHSTRQIAERLHLSVKTIESYRENLKVKIGIRTGSELIQRAIQWGKTAGVSA